jgi:hypothetical protein
MNTSMQIRSINRNASRKKHTENRQVVHCKMAKGKLKDSRKYVASANRTALLLHLGDLFVHVRALGMNDVHHSLLRILDVPY